MHTNSGWTGNLHDRSEKRDGAGHSSRGLLESLLSHETEITWHRADTGCQDAKAEAGPFSTAGCWVQDQPPLGFPKSIFKGLAPLGTQGDVPLLHCLSLGRYLLSRTLMAPTGGTVRWSSRT